MSDFAVGGMSGISSINLQSMDLETALMMVQSERTKLLDAQLASQIEAVQARNGQVAKLNDVLSALNKAMAQFPPKAAASDTIPNWDADKVRMIEVPLNDAILAAGISDLGFQARQGRITDPSDPGKTQVLGAATNLMQAATTKGEFDVAIAKVKGMIDSQSNNQQMDMVRLQSMSNKRNEAFDVMTNFVKKMQDNRSSIIGNMR